MKRIILLISVVFGLSGCSDWLDLTPLDKISDKGIFEDQRLCDAYMQKLYADVELQKKGGQADTNMGMYACMAGEMMAFAGWQEPDVAAFTNFTLSTGPTDLIDYWPYAQIRRMNEFIEGVKNSKSLPESFKNQRIAEVRFLRAWNYFQMVKRFGGVPIVTIVIPDDAPDEVMYPKRNTETEVYDFIEAELNDIFNILPNRQLAADFGRPTKWAAMAFKSRAMLYAASIAKFGTPLTDANGYVGISSSKADSYYTKSYNASDSIIKFGGFALYNKLTDKTKNFEQLFIDENGNTEAIFSVGYDFVLKKGHSWDNLCIPAGFTSSWNSNFNPFLETVDLFDNQDGTSGKLDRSKLTAAYQYDVNEIFGKRDPRFKASIFYPGTMFQGKPPYYHSSTIYTNASGARVTTTSETFIIPGSTDKLPYQLYGGWPGKGPNRNVIKSGFQVRKRIDEAFTPSREGQSNTDFHVFRLGEIYLNLAEAAFYLNKTSESVTAINAVRSRAGMPLRDATLTEAQIRQERRCELLFEEHAYWDLKRWRIAETELNGKRFQGLTYVYDYDTGKYIITLKGAGAEANPRIFSPQHYYMPLGLARVASNKGLVENPGYK